MSMALALVEKKVYSDEYGFLPRGVRTRSKEPVSSYAEH